MVCSNNSSTKEDQTSSLRSLRNLIRQHKGQLSKAESTGRVCKHRKDKHDHSQMFVHGKILEDSVEFADAIAIFETIKGGVGTIPKRESVRRFLRAQRIAVVGHESLIWRVGKKSMSKNTTSSNWSSKLDNKSLGGD